MADPPIEVEALPNNREVRPAFSISYFSLFLITSLIASVITLLVAKSWSKITEQEEDQKLLQLTILPAQNIATPPENITIKLEYTVSIDQQVVKSLFGFQVSVRNASKKTLAENVLVYLRPPTNVELIEPPTINTNSQLLQISAQSSRKAVDGGGVTFTLEQLPAGHQVSLSYTGFSRQVALGPTWLYAEIRAKDWKITRYGVSDGEIPGGTYGGYPDGTYDFVPDGRVAPSDPYSPAGKRLADYTMIDAIALFLALLTLSCALGICAWLLTRFLLPTYLTAWKAWRSH